MDGEHVQFADQRKVRAVTPRMKNVGGTGKQFVRKGILLGNVGQKVFHQ